MIERRTGPRCSVMARGAGRWEASRGVIGIRGPGEILRVAAVAVRRQRCVVVIDVASSAGHSDVGAGQRERRLAVIEWSAGPRRGVMARRARGWEADRRVRRSVGVVEVGFVAAIAVRGKPAGVIVIHVAQCALHGDVRAGQRERRCVVIERCSRPHRNGVAHLTIRREATRDVIGVCRPVVISLMAGVASRGRRRVVVVGVALRARHFCVPARKWVVRVKGVVELGIRPI